MDLVDGNLRPFIENQTAPRVVPIGATGLLGRPVVNRLTEGGLDGLLQPVVADEVVLHLLLGHFIGGKAAAGQGSGRVAHGRPRRCRASAGNHDQA